MIIQCEQCQTKFKLDDSKVADKGIKVRCARCRHVFSVAGPQGAPGGSASFGKNAPVFQIDEEQEVAAASAPETVPGFETDTFSFAADDEQPEQVTPAPADDDSAFSFPSVDSTVSHDRAETQHAPDDLDFGAFDFGDEGSEPAVAATSLKSEVKAVKPARTTPPKEEFGGLDFSGDDMFGDVVSQTADESPAESISFDMGMEGFADSMGVEGGSAGQSASSKTHDLTAETPFSLDDIDFGDELTSVAVQQVSTEALKPGKDLLFAPLAKAQTQHVDDIFADTFSKTSAAPAQDDLPPLSITSRRKEGPRVSSMIVFMSVIIAGLVIFYATWGYMTLTEETSQLSTQEEGRITVRSVEASFVKNKKAGDLLVISGEAVNEYDKPRAAIQIKGIVFGPNDEEMSSKIAFCGNPLSKEQLTTMSMDKIEAAMANQFGDSLANMEVAPGTAIPFVIVIAKPPAGATDYGVEPAGSTVAAIKEK
jgi:predicted Zn finger-like uncharacterized protein